MASSSRNQTPDPASGYDDPRNINLPQYASLDEVMEELSSRFILNLPEHEFSSVERICFQVEQAHWHYEDFIRETNPHFPSMPLKKFSEWFFQTCPLLKHWSADHEQAFNNFMQYKTRVPVCGAIMLNSARDKCVLVKGWKSSSGWSFPRGKINEDEPPMKCAVREVLEETGYDISRQIREEDFIEINIREQRVSLFIVPGVPEDFLFQTKTRKEISKIEWFRLIDLPTWRRNKTVPGKFYLIPPFITQLKYWLSERRARESGQRGKLNNREPRHGHRSHLSAAVGSTDQGSRRIGQERPIQQELDIQSLDPHMARLLSGLTLSAQPGTGAHDGSSQGSVVGSTPSRPTSTDESLSSVAPSPYMVPTSTSARSNESGVTARDVNHAQLVASAPTRGEVPNAIITNVSALPSSSPMTTPRSATLSSTWTSTSTSSGPTSMTSSGILPSPHGSTSTAERSPYLSQPPEPLSSDKRMKHLALLETVVDESARQAAISRAGTAMGMAGNHSTQHHVGNSPSTALPPVDLVAALSQAKHPQPAPVVVSHHDLPPSAHHPYSSNVPSYRPQLNPPLIRPQPVTASHSSNLSLQGWPRGSAPDPQLLSLLTSGPAPPAQYPAFYPPRSQALSTAPREHGFINNGPVWPQMSDGIMQGVMQNGYHRSYPGSAAPFPSSMPGPSATPFIRPPVLPKTTNIASTANLLSILNTTAPAHPAHHTTVRPPPYAS